MHNDDRPVGRAFTRRDLVKLFGLSGRVVAGRAAAQPLPAGAAPESQDCIAQPQQTEGPYFVEEGLQRSDVRVNGRGGRVSAGAPLELRFVVSSVSERGVCALRPGAQVDIWHRDATGVYFDVRDIRVDTTGQAVPPRLSGHGREWRGTVPDDLSGWYPGRAVHIHFKVRIPAPGGGRTSSRRTSTSTTGSRIVCTRGPPMRSTGASAC